MNTEQPMFETDELDVLLRRALQARPQPQPTGDLAFRAMQLAHTSDRAAVALAQLKRQRRWIRLLTAAAIVLVAVVLFIGGRRTVQLAPLSFGSIDSAQTDTTSTDSATTTSQTYEARTTALLAASICCGAILLLALRRAFEPDPRFLEAWHLPRAC